MTSRTHGSIVKRWVLSLALLTGLGISLRAEDAPPKPEDLFPDTTLAAIAFPDLEAARKAANATRIGELLQQPEMRDFLDPIIARMSAQYAESRAVNPALPSLEDLDKGVFSGEISVCVFSHGAGQEPGVVFSIKPKDTKAFDTILNTAFKAVSHGQQDLPKDVPFPLGEGENVPGLLYSKGRLLLVKPMADMVAVAERIGDASKRAKGTLGSNANFKEAHTGMHDAAAWVYANPSALIEIGEEAAAANGGAQAAQVKAMLNAMGLDKLSSMLLGFTFEGGEPSTEMYLGLDGDVSNKGVFSLIGTKAPSKALFQIAAPESPYVGAASFNFAAMLPLVRSVVNAIDPNVNKQIDEGLANVNGMLKFDIEKDLLQNLDGQFVSAQTPFDTAMPFSITPGIVSLMHLKDPAKMEECLGKLKAFADGMKLSDKIPAFYTRYDMVTYKGTKIYYISQLLNGGAALAVVKDHLIMGNSLNAAKRGIDQMAASSNILSSKDFQATLARVSGKPFDAEKLPLSFAYSTDMGSGGGVLALSVLALTAETAAVAGIAEAVNQGKELPPDPAGPDMFGLGELKSKPAGRAALNVLNSMDLNRWPDEEFFVKRRQSHASVGVRTAKGWMSRGDMPPPLPHYSSGAIVPALIAITAAVAIPNFMKAKNAANNAMINQLQPPTPKAAQAVGALNNLRQIHLAITLFETDHNALPTKAADLFPQYITDASVFKDPANPKKDVAYELVTGVLSKDADAILAFENPGEAKAKRGRNVLKTDGSVEHLTDEEFKTQIKETEEIVTKGGRKFGTVSISVKDISKK